MVEAAQGSKLPIQALVDRVTGWFVPAAILAARLTFCAWMILRPSPALSFALVNTVAVPSLVAVASGSTVVEFGERDDRV
ncbi:MAG TPA: hypothetical protein DCW88_02045 [Agrobacterium sp.]|nr:MAG: hypothetical protein DI604_36730 [Delftia acidovorans]RSC41458.1 hypothetical protein EGT36_00475 [Agrobacterium sp. FDAARGOS_525]HAU74344.1 hypothetical protein [Agrobacterium sp.]